MNPIDSALMAPIETAGVTSDGLLSILIRDCGSVLAAAQLKDITRIYQHTQQYSVEIQYPSLPDIAVQNAFSHLKIEQLSFQWSPRTDEQAIEWLLALRWSKQVPLTAILNLPQDYDRNLIKFVRFCRRFCLSMLLQCSPTAALQAAEQIATQCEILDKILMVYGFPKEIVGSLLQRLRLQRRSQPVLHSTPLAYVGEDHAVEITRSFKFLTGIDPLVHSCSATGQATWHHGKEESVRYIRGRTIASMAKEVSDLGAHSTAVRFIIDDPFVTRVTEICSHLEHVQQLNFSIQVPYWSRRRALSVVAVAHGVEHFLQFARSKNWNFLGGRPGVDELGLELTDQISREEVLLQQTTNQKPALSVIAATYNRAFCLPTFLRSLSLQSTKEFELVIIDDGSTDESSEVAATSLKSLKVPFDYKVIRLARSRPYDPQGFNFRAALARQVGAKYSKADRLVFLDPDQEIDRDCLESHQYFGAFADVILGVRTYPIRTPDEFEIGEKAIGRHDSAVRRKASWWPMFFTGNSSVSRILFDGVGGFDVTLQHWGLEDLDLAYRLQLAGASIWHTRRAQVQHFSDLNVGRGEHPAAERKNFWLICEILYRKYFSLEILNAFSFLWNS